MYATKPEIDLFLDQFESALGAGRVPFRAFNDREPMVDCGAIYKPFDRSATFTERMCLLLLM